MITLKAIVPSRSKLDYGKLAVAVNKALYIAEYDLRVQFEKTVKTWVREPFFGVTRYQSPLSFRYGFEIYPKGRWAKVYEWVDYGTSPHPLEARNAPYMVFLKNVGAKTRPRYITSYMGHRSKPWRRRKYIDHPGAKPREFSATIAKRYQPTWEKSMRNVIEKAAKDLEE